MDVGSGVSGEAGEALRAGGGAGARGAGRPGAGHSVPRFNPGFRLLHARVRPSQQTCAHAGPPAAPPLQGALGAGPAALRPSGQGSRPGPRAGDPWPPTPAPGARAEGSGLGVQPPSCPRGGFGAGRSAAGHADPTPRPLTPRSAPFLLSTSAASGSFSPERRRRQSWGFRVLRGAHGPRRASRSRRRVQLAPGRGFLAPPPRADRTASWRAAADLPPAHARAADRPPQGETQPGSGRAGGPRQPQHRLGRGRCRGCCHAGSHGTRARFRASSAGQSMFRVYV